MSKRLNMSNDEAAEWLLSLKNLDICGECRKTAIDKAVTALKSPKKKECDNFEAQPKIGHISIDTNKLAKEVAEKVLDEITYNGKTIREWAEIIVKQQPSEDCISRKSIRQKLQEHHDFFVNAYGGFSNLPQNDKSRVDEIDNCIAMVVNEPSVTPQIEPCEDCISRESVIEWLKDKDIIKMKNQEENARRELAELPSVTPQRPEGRWIEVLENRNEFGSTWHYECSECRAKSYKGFEPLERYCPNCGAEMNGGRESEG